MFEEITDTFSDMGDGAKKGFEKIKDFISDNKLLCIGIGGVAVYALYKMYADNSTSTDNEYASTYAYVPTGYDGYPTMSESVSYDDAVNQLKNETADDLGSFKDEILSDISQIVDNMQTDTDKKLDSVVTLFSDNTYKVNESQSYVEEQRQNNTVTYEDIIAQMQKNSEMWHETDSQEQKDLLHQQNVQLGTMLGATFDSSTGTWNSEGSQIYEVSTKNKTTSTTGGTTKVSASSGSSGSSSSSSSSNSLSQSEINAILDYGSTATYNMVAGLGSGSTPSLVVPSSSSSSKSSSSSSSSTSSNVNKVVSAVNNALGISSSSSSSKSSSSSSSSSGGSSFYSDYLSRKK